MVLFLEYQIGHDQKLFFFASRTSASVIKLRNVLGKIQKITKKGFMGEILQGLYFDLPNFDWFGHICEAKNFFFWEMTPTFHNFPNCLTYQRMFWYQNPSKKVSPRSRGIFPRETHFFFPNKTQKYGNFEIELERVSHQ